MKRKEDGVLTLEASICLFLFIFLMLFLYSLFVVFEARNVVAQATLATADSLSLDVYQTEKMQGGDNLLTFVTDVYKLVVDNDSPFYSDNKWYTQDGIATTWNNNVYVSAEGTEGDDDFQDRYGNSAYVSSAFADVVKERFFAYLVGSDNAAAIDAFLNKYHIVGGQEGISFTGTRIVDGNLYVVVTYQIDYEFNLFDSMDITFKQSACSKIWK